MHAERAGRALDTVAARAAMLAVIRPLAPERISIDAAAGRTLAVTLQATRAQPPFRCAAMDGYGIGAAAGPAGEFTVRGEALAGRAYAGAACGPADAIRIFTGAPVPEGVELIVPQERARRQGDRVWLDLSAPLRRNIRDAGCDFTDGAVLIERGTRLHARHLALIAAAGLAEVSVTRAPRIGVLATGNEIVAPGAQPAPQQIFDSVSFGVAAMIRQWGGEPRRGARCADDRGAIALAVEQALADADLLVIIGGASVGDYDLVKGSLAAAGLAVIVPRVALRPGKPSWFGTVAAKPLLGLAGNPAAAMVCAQLFLRPLVHALLARQVAVAPELAVLDGELGATGSDEYYPRAILSEDPQARARVRPCADQDTSLVSVFAAANALIRRPPGAGPAARGELVEVIRLGGD